MKNLSLLLLALVASPVEAANYASLVSGKTEVTKTGKRKSLPATATTTPAPSLANSITNESAPVITEEPRASSANHGPTQTSLAVAESEGASAADTLLRAAENTQLDHSKHQIIRSYQEWNKTRNDKKISRFEKMGEISEAFKKHESAFNEMDANNHSLSKDISNRLEALPYVRPTDENSDLKKREALAISDLKVCEKTLPLLIKAKTKDQKTAVLESINGERSNYFMVIGKETKQIQTRSLREILTTIAKKQIDPYATSTESARTISGCGQSIIEGSRISDIERTATNFASTSAEKTAILESKRIAEFTTLLAQLESYSRARDLETNSQAKLDELETKANSLESKLLHPISENDRIETERALLGISREKAGIIGQLAGAKKDRTRKNNAICVARTELGSYKTWLGALGGKTADYAADSQETPLMIEELFSKVLPQLSKEEKRKKALAFLDILTGKIKTTASTKLTWTSQQSVKMVTYPEFSCIIDGKDLSGKKGTEREIVLFSTENINPLNLVAALPLAELYKKRACFTVTQANSLNIPTLEQLHTQRETRTHWKAKGFDDRALEWAQKQPAAPTTPNSEFATV